jgi:hypothetical protein
MKNLGEYHHLYLRTDVYLLADTFQAFRQLSRTTFGLDPAHYLTAPGLAWDAMLKTPGISLELIKDKDQLDFVKVAIRGGMCGSYNARYFKANNPKCPDYDKLSPTTWLMLLDANNLYGGVMQEPLPYGGLEWSDINLSDILNTDDDADCGFFVMVDLEYPTELHDLHSDFPLAPEHMTPTYDMLSPYQKSLLPRSKLVKSLKLMQTLSKKDNYVCHYRMLKFIVSHGVKVTKLVRVLKFKQSRWMSDYIDINTQLRKTATTECQKDLGKLFNNSVYGKSMEDLLNRMSVKLITNDEECSTFTCKPTFKKFTLIQDNLIAIVMGKTKVTWNKPTYIGAAVLELSKLVMFKFFYEVMRPRYGLKVKMLYSDTDSMLVGVETENLYTDLKDMKEHFDFHKYPLEHPLFDEENKMKVLKFKDELDGRIMLEYVGLKPKMYSMKYLTKEDTYDVKQSCKGVTYAVKKGLHHDKYKEVLDSGESIRRQMNVMRSDRMTIYTQVINKIALSGFDDKRYITHERSLPYGHHSIDEDYLPPLKKFKLI